jgi:hypothetical protein
MDESLNCKLEWWLYYCISLLSLMYFAEYIEFFIIQDVQCGPVLHHYDV